MIGGYAQLSYGFNYYGTIGTNRDEFVVVRKMREVDWMDQPTKTVGGSGSQDDGIRITAPTNASGPGGIAKAGTPPSRTNPAVPA